MACDYYHVAQVGLRGNGVQDAAYRCDDEEVDDDRHNDTHSNNNMDGNRQYEGIPYTRKQCHLRKNS